MTAPVRIGPVDAARPPGATEVLAQSRTENFPVASRVLPRALRTDLMALYGFARLVDDAGDEAAGDRGALLDWLDDELDAVYGGRPEHPIMRELVPTVRRHAIPREPFDLLIAANRQDQQVNSYATFEDLLGYCRMSADPVGRLVLHVFDAATPDRIARSDRVCSGLQIVEHLQDVSEDLARGRVYLPSEDLDRFGVTPADLARTPAPQHVRGLIAFEAGRAGTLLDDGPPLARTLPLRAALAVAAFAAGGLAAIDALRAASFDVTAGPPRAGSARRAAKLLAVLARTAGGRR